MVWVKKYHTPVDYCLCCLTPYSIKPIVMAFILARWPERFVGVDKRDVSLIVHFNDHKDTTLLDIREVILKFRLDELGTCSRKLPVEICK